MKGKKSKKILIILGRGGHTEQVLRLLNKLQNRFDYEYVVGSEDNTSESKINYPGRIYKVKNPRLMSDKSILKVGLKMIPTSLKALYVLLISRPEAIISAGPSLTLPFYPLAKLMRIKTIFIESWVRVKNKSITGNLIYPYSDLFLVQWPEMKKKYPKAIFAGRLS